MYETFDHTADLGLRVTADSLAELFVEAARGLTAQIVENPEEIRPLEAVTLEVRAPSREDLLFDWLSELLYQYECRSLVFSSFLVQLKTDGGSLHAECFGEHIDRARHRLANEVKAVTYHDFLIEETPNGWRAEFIVDI